MIPALIAVGGVWGVVFGDEGLLKRHAVKQRLYVMQERVASIETENEALRLKIQRLREDPVALRRAAAEQLLAAEPGSTIYRFTDTGAPAPP